MKKQDTAAERAVLSLICQNNYGAYVEAFNLIDVNTFTIDSNQVIYKCIKHIFEKNSEVILDPISIISAANELSIGEFFTKKTERDHLEAIFKIPANRSNMKEFVGKIKKLEIIRQLGNSLCNIQDDLEDLTGKESLSSIISVVETPILDFSSSIYRNDDTRPEHIGEGLDAYLDHLESNPTQIVGISTGYPIFDDAVGGGLEDGTLHLIGARSGVGKTMFGINVALYTSTVLGIPTLYLDTEILKKQHWNRFLALISGVKINDIKTGKYDEKGLKDRVRRAAEKLKSSKFFYQNVSGRMFDEIMGIARRWLLQEVGKNKNAIIFYDYLKTTNSKELSGDLSEHQLLGFQASYLHDFAVANKIPIVSFVQLNRDGITEESQAVVAGSDRIVHLCDSLSIYKPKTEEEINESSTNVGNMKLVIQKARDGAGLKPGDWINFQFDGPTAKIVEMGTRYAPPANHAEFLITEKIESTEFE